MKRYLILSLSLIVLSAGLVTDAAARGGHGHGHGHGGHHGHGHGGSHFGFYLGDPFFWGHSHYYRPYPPAYYYDPPPAPPVYVQRQPAPVWYYCPDPAGYYPYVPSCSRQWVTVDPDSVPPR